MNVLKMIKIIVHLMICNNYTSGDITIGNILRDAKIEFTSLKMWRKYIHSFVQRAMKNNLYNLSNIQNFLFQQQGTSSFLGLHSKQVLQLELYSKSRTTTKA